MAASHRKSGITARDLLRHPTPRGTDEGIGTAEPGPIHGSTSLEEILPLLGAATADAIDVVDEHGRLEGTITREDAIHALARAIDELAEERRVLQLAVERQRVALDEATERLERIRETLDLAEELRRGSPDAGSGLPHAVEEIRRILGAPRRG
jgi:CBS domain-containing protein